MAPLHSLSGKHVLVVGDDAGEAAVIASRLAAIGMEVIKTASDVDRALAPFAQGEIAAAVLDIRPGNDTGFPVADELVRLGIPFLFITGTEPAAFPAAHAARIVLRSPVEDQALTAALLQLVHPVSLDDARRNLILARLPEAGLDLILPRLRRMSLRHGAVLECPGHMVDQAYFPVDCVGSLIVTGRQGSQIETGLIGREGMTGQGLADGDDGTAYQLIIQIEGEALAMTAEDFQAAIVDVPELGELAGRFARSLGVQASYTALANGKFELRQRLARWLVMVHDRVPGRTFELTQDYMAVMLGVRRSTVTDTLHVLEGEQLLRSTRGSLEIRNRDGLAAVAGEAFGMPEAEYERLMALPRGLRPTSVKHAVRLVAT